MKKESRIGLLLKHNDVNVLIVTRGFMSIDEIKVSLNIEHEDIVNFLKSAKSFNELNYLVVLGEDIDIDNLRQHVRRVRGSIRILTMHELFSIVGDKKVIETYILFMNKLIKDIRHLSSDI